MGLQCSILGHAFEEAGVDREREEQGREVITTEREIERCRRCGAERVVSESTEVAAVVDASDVDGVDADRNDADRDGSDPTAESAAASDPAGGGLTGAVERSATGESETGPAGSDAGEHDGDGLNATPPGDTPETPDIGAPSEGSPGSDDALDPIDPDAPLASSDDDAPSDPAEEDAEILTDDDVERAPGQWPDEPVPDSDSGSEGTASTDGDDPIAPVDEPLSGITVPDGEIVCPACTFRIEADSGYRSGDPCPECNAWLEAERNQ